MAQPFMLIRFVLPLLGRLLFMGMINFKLTPLKVREKARKVKGSRLSEIFNLLLFGTQLSFYYDLGFIAIYAILR